MTQNSTVISKTGNPVLVTQFELSKAITFSKLFSKVKLTSSARLVLRALVDHWNPNKSYCFPKQSTLSDETGCSIRSVGNAIDELRSKGLILTNGDKGDSLKYYLTAKFFDLVEIAQPSAKNAYVRSAKIAEHEQIKSKQINKGYFQKKSNASKPVNEIKYMSSHQTKQTIQSEFNKPLGSPMDYNYDEAVKWLNSLPEFAKNGFFAKELRKKFNL